LTADKLDVSQSSGDAVAHGNVKATWLGDPAGKPTSDAKAPAMTLGGQGPAHVIASEALLHQATGQATFKGQVRLWQGPNSVSAPVVVLDRPRQILLAHGASPADPVKVVMLSAGGSGMGKTTPSAVSGKGAESAGPASPAVIRIRGGDLKYSEAERKAVMQGAQAGTVVADTGTATVVSNQLEIVLLPPGNHAGPDGEPAQVDRVTATGRVSVASQGRHGAGEQLVYSSETGEYVLTGTPAHPPTLTDPAKGTVRGTSLIFSSRDDSVSIEGGAGKTFTETIAPK
jgi:lipopolysaccharide export system protein LptA